MCPQFVVDADKAVARNDPHRDLVGETLGLQIRVVGKHPDVPELVGHRCVEFIGIQPRKKAAFDRKLKRLPATDRCFHGNDERDLRLNRDIHVLANTELLAQPIDDQLDPIDHDHGGFCRRSTNREKQERTDRRQNEP
jgi:hypothetical protein